MSKQLTISAAISIFAMAAFIVLGVDAGRQSDDLTQTGAETHASAPAPAAHVHGLAIIR